MMTQYDLMNWEVVMVMIIMFGAGSMFAVSIYQLVQQHKWCKAANELNDEDMARWYVEYHTGHEMIIDDLPFSFCYQCDKRSIWLAEDGRCKDCTRLTPEEVRGDYPPL